MIRKLMIVGVAVLLVLGGVYAAKRNKPGQNSGKLQVVASFYPMGEFTRQVGQEHVQVTTLVKPGVEPHDYDPTPQDMVAVHQSKVLVYNGAGLEPWADKLADELSSDGIVVVKASDGLPLVNKAGGDSEDNNASTYDPHVWLDPVMASREVDAIRDGLVKADPKHQADFERNAAAYKQELASLDVAYRDGLKQCERHEIVAAHQAFRYIAARYGFEALGIAGLSPEEEPSPQKLVEVTQFARQHNVKYIFFEALASPKLTETIAREVGAKTLVFNPLEGLSQEELGQSEDYVSVQRDNLENVRLALDCK